MPKKNKKKEEKVKIFHPKRRLSRYIRELRKKISKFKKKEICVAGFEKELKFVIGEEKKEKFITGKSAHDIGIRLKKFLCIKEDDVKEDDDEKTGCC